MTEDVIFVVSIDTRIERETRRNKKMLEALLQPIKLLEVQALQQAREWIHDDLVNMWLRFDSNNRGKKEDVPRWLHTKTFDETFIDLGPEGKSMRTRRRIQLLLNHLDGDTATFLRLYAEELNSFFPIKGSYEWAPVLVGGVTHSGRPILTVKYRWHRIKPVEADPGSESVGFAIMGPPPRVVE